jgi:dolichol-phosphate mannosyltransferase
MDVPSSCCIDAQPASAVAPAARPDLAVVIPCFNEAESLSKLACELERLQAALAGKRVEWLFVDDGSTDSTWHLLKELSAEWPGVRLLRHGANRGIAAAIQTGISQATAPIVASLDADCTYDPLTLLPLLDAMTDEVDLAVASPYHPAGDVVGVPFWRLGLSRLASGLYRLVMRNRLFTYTSCVRVYRKSAVADLPLAHGGFVGVVDLLWQLDRRGGKIVERPAVLKVRTTGHSKMRIATTAIAHLCLIARAALDRLSGDSPTRHLHRDLQLEPCETTR